MICLNVNFLNDTFGCKLFYGFGCKLFYGFGCELFIILADGFGFKLFIISDDMVECELFE